MAQKFWGHVFEAASCVPLMALAIPVLLVAETVEKVTGTDANDFIKNNIDPFIPEFIADLPEKAGEFGDEHNNKINGAIVGAVAAALTGQVINN